jgi:CelD/BcsL family acetyltransferase involved in cellulose biosynthesis
VEFVESLEPLGPEWAEQARLADNIFSTWEWCSTWWRHFGRGRRLSVGACRSTDGRLRAILPLYRARERPLSVTRFIGYGTADELRPICAPPELARAGRALRTMLERLPYRCDVFFGDQVPSDVGLAPVVGGRALQTIPSPLLRLDGLSWDELLASHSARFRKRLRYLERRLGGAHAVEYRRSDDAAHLDRDLDALFALHRARWGASAFAAEEPFHREFAPRALEAGWLRLWLLELDGQPVAAWYGFRFGDAVSHYQSGRDPSRDQESVGFLLSLRTIRAAIDEGASEYRFLRGGEQYKARLADGTTSLETIGVALTDRGTLALRVAAALADHRGGRLPGLYRRLASLTR